jgi:hypothetical protein
MHSELKKGFFEMKIIQVTGKTAGDALAAARTQDATGIFLWLMRGISAAFSYFPNWFREGAEDFWHPERLNVADGDYRWFVLSLGPGEGADPNVINSVEGAPGTAGGAVGWTAVKDKTLEAAVAQLENWQPSTTGIGGAERLQVIAAARSDNFDSATAAATGTVAPPLGDTWWFSMGVIPFGTAIDRHYCRAITAILQTTHDLKL